MLSRNCLLISNLFSEAIFNFSEPCPFSPIRTLFWRSSKFTLLFNEWIVICDVDLHFTREKRDCQQFFLEKSNWQTFVYTLFYFLCTRFVRFFKRNFDDYSSQCSLWKWTLWVSLRCNPRVSLAFESAALAQLVEHHHGKVGDAGSSPAGGFLVKSQLFNKELGFFCFAYP